MIISERVPCSLVIRISLGYLLEKAKSLIRIIVYPEGITSLDQKTVSFRGPGRQGVGLSEGRLGGIALLKIDVGNVKRVIGGGKIRVDLDGFLQGGPRLVEIELAVVIAAFEIVLIGLHRARGDIGYGRLFRSGLVPGQADPFEDLPGQLVDLPVDDT